MMKYLLIILALVSTVLMGSVPSTRRPVEMVVVPFDTAGTLPMMFCDGRHIALASTAVTFDLPTGVVTGLACNVASIAAAATVTIDTATGIYDIDGWLDPPDDLVTSINVASAAGGTVTLTGMANGNWTASRMFGAWAD